MPRNNNIITRVFTDIVRDKLYDTFLEVEQEKGLVESEILSAMKEKYLNNLANIRRELKTISRVEEVIIQLRSKEQIDSELRLSLSRNYIYARSVFYRMDKEINDIRVLIGKTEDHGEGINVLIKDPNFRELCKSKLIEAMDEIIQLNVQSFYQPLTK
jgi:uncharacterized protein YlxW (UPF0749 family)